MSKSVMTWNTDENILFTQERKRENMPIRRLRASDRLWHKQETSKRSQVLEVWTTQTSACVCITATNRGRCFTDCLRGRPQDSMFYLQFGGSSFDEATDDLLHPLGVPHVNRRFLKLRHLHGDTDRQTDGGYSTAGRLATQEVFTTQHGSPSAQRRASFDRPIQDGFGLQGGALARKQEKFGWF